MRRVIPVILCLCLLLALAVPVGAAEPMSDAFKEYLNEDGQLPIPSMVPPNEEYAMALGDLYYESGFNLSDWSDDFRSCRMTVWELDESHVVEPYFMYDPTVAEVAKELIATFPDNMEDFRVRDMELVNYWISTAALAIDPDTDVTQSLDNYSGELKSLLKNKNFRLTVDNRAGDDSPFWIARKGIAALMMDDAIYYIHPFLGVRADHVIYLPEDTATDADSLLAAAQKRMDDYAPGKVKVELGGNDIKQFFLDNMDAMYKDAFLSAWADPNSEYAFLKTAAGGCYFTAKIGDTAHHFITVKDDDQMLSPTYAAADAKTDVRVSSADISVPLDTQMRVEKLTEGDEYERIIKALDGKIGPTYDINLHSMSLDEKVSDGEFLVAIPLPEGFDKQHLTACYVDEEDKVEHHEVTVKDGYALFMTYHFSAYTLVATENPPTGDAALLWSVLAMVAMGAAAVLVIGRKKCK